MKQYKKLTALCLIFILVGVVYPARAAVAAGTDVIARPMYNAIDSFSNSFDISSSGLANVYSSVYAGTASSTYVSVYLEKNNSGTWSSVTSWSASSNSYTAGAGGTYYVTHGQYRIRSSCYVYIGGTLADYDSYISYTITY